MKYPGVGTIPPSPGEIPASGGNLSRVVEENRPPALLYLDVDGVLIGHGLEGGRQPVLAAGALDLLGFSLEKFTCFWLSSHCRDGNAGPLLRYLARLAGPAFMELAARVVPAAWRSLKTEAIDFSADFYWLEDRPLQAELDCLARLGAAGRLLRVDTRAEPDGLFRVLSRLRRLTG